MAERRGQRVILARNLLGTLRNRELAQPPRTLPPEPAWNIARWLMDSAWPHLPALRHARQRTLRDAR